MALESLQLALLSSFSRQGSAAQGQWQRCQMIRLTLGKTELDSVKSQGAREQARMVNE